MDRIGNLTLRDITLPGTHDSASFSVTDELIDLPSVRNYFGCYCHCELCLVSLSSSQFLSVFERSFGRVVKKISSGVKLLCIIAIIMVVMASPSLSRFCSCLKSCASQFVLHVFFPSH